jgi:hypothetical protein
MSETGVGASSTVQEGVLLDEAGNRISREVRSEGRDLEPLVRFARAQPVATAVLALGIGYLIGKIL